MVLKANDRRHLALCHGEFRGPRSGLCRSGGISDKNKAYFPLSWYWSRTRDMPAMIRYLGHWATAAQKTCHKEQLMQVKYAEAQSPQVAILWN
ncbi:hypothetical protein TNCV_3558991 [Trichonephila clavipes]|uniref:Uncharacterized protein n=1 Tax=Trichonephila clavipes TaxID=2585209 RepID=A0A8X6WDV0_TRICX|nr:hypothetical protein TNCV_3558991 [Trichonephila clavipes]